MKLTFDSKEEKARVIEVAHNAADEARSQFYLHLLENSLVEGEEAPLPEPEPSLVDENIEQIEGF